MGNYRRNRDYGKFNDLLLKYSREEATYFKSLSNDKKEEIYDIEKQIDNYKIFKEPLRFKFLSMNTIVASHLT